VSVEITGLSTVMHVCVPSASVMHFVNAMAALPQDNAPRKARESKGVVTIRMQLSCFKSLLLSRPVIVIAFPPGRLNYIKL
jgi:hypothetical protein